MTRKHFKRIASILNNLQSTATSLDDFRASIRLAAIQISDVLQQENPNFKKGTFLRACGIPSNDK